MISQATDETKSRTQYLTFSLLGEDYAVGILSVREILEYDTVTRIPHAPASVRGAINLRGRVVPVVDLAVRFGQPPQGVSPRTCIVILEVGSGSETTVTGVVVDSVSQVIDLGEDELLPPPTFGTSARPQDLLGMAPMGKKFALVLDVERTLSSYDSVVVEEAVVEPILEQKESEGDA
jgi:purine-binding chemotaxis protein CheW